MATFSERLKELRKEKNITQKQVADAVGIAERNYRRLEADNSPNVKTLNSLADFFDVSVDYLLGRVNFWHDAEVRITVKVPPNIVSLGTDEIKKSDPKYHGQ